MITDERFVAYINSLDAGNPAYLDELEAYAIQTQVPIIRKEMQSFMRTMLLMNKPKRILEVGTAIGFSALLMSEFMPQDGHITTIENYEKRIPIARANFQKYGKEERITLLEGDAAEVLKTVITSMEEKACTVIVPNNQLSLAIGNKGQNAKLAAKLTGFKIDIKPQFDNITGEEAPEMSPDFVAPVFEAAPPVEEEAEETAPAEETAEAAAEEEAPANEE